MKLRGFRIELGEIESALRAHPAVTDAVAARREDMPGDPRLVAYVVAAASPAELRAHLARRLPSPMVPAAIVTLERLPTTATGKVDRAGAPAAARAHDGGHLVARSRARQ